MSNQLNLPEKKGRTLNQVSPNPTSRSSTKSHYPRLLVAETVTDFKKSRTSSTRRQYARDRGIPYGTLSHWLDRYDEIPLDDEVKAFFESPVGVVFLHTLQVALNLCFVQEGTASIRNISRFLEITKLDCFLPGSIGSQYKLNHDITRQIIAFGEAETTRLASQMSKTKICLAEDETYHPHTMYLVAIDARTGFIILECRADKRDSATWTELVEKALEGLNVEVVWQTSDEAAGLLHHTRHGLAVVHAPDLFHILNELVKATSRPPAAEVQRAEQKYQELIAPLATILLPERMRIEPNPKLRKKQSKALETRDQARERRQKVQEARHAISDTCHPYNLTTGESRSTEEATESFSAAFQKIRSQIAHLSAKCFDKVAKAERVIPATVEAIARFFVMIRIMVDESIESPTLRHQLHTALIPGFYLHEVARKTADPEKRAAIVKPAERLLFPFQQRAGPFRGLTEATCTHLESLAYECATLFQRSSSCVEGRNGHLARYQRGSHRLSEIGLGALTVLHNYWIRRWDETTPAERLFGMKHGDLFRWLVDRIDLPSRPHNRKKNKDASTAG